LSSGPSLTEFLIVIDLLRIARRPFDQPLTLQLNPREIISGGLRWDRCSEG